MTSQETLLSPVNQLLNVFACTESCRYKGDKWFSVLEYHQPGKHYTANVLAFIAVLIDHKVVNHGYV